MFRVIGLSFVGIFFIAGFKTYLILLLVVPDAPLTKAFISIIYVIVFSVTSAQAYGYYIISNLRTSLQNAQNPTFEANKPVAKETIILNNAIGWGLSKAEADVAIFVTKGFSNAEIANMRGCAIATVKSQLGQIYAKTGMGSRYQLISFVTDEVCAVATKSDPKTAKAKPQDAPPLSRPTPPALAKISAL